MPRIPEETIQQVLAATDIVDLVGRYVKLRRMGSTFRGLCPFHNEKTPSFYVTPSRGTYHCFGCGVGGSAIRFLMEHDGMQFVEAVKRLGDAAGIRIEEEVWDENAAQDAKVKELLRRVHKDIAAWYHDLLMRHKAAEEARQYLKSRGMTAEVAKKWQIGYAPPWGDMLREWAIQKGYSENVLIDAGIMAMGDPDSGRSGTYPRFRHRLMFPIRNDNGEVIAFSGRLLDANVKAAKYVNSPETPLFTKSKVLFGFDKSKRAISKAGQAIVVEGQIDMMTVFDCGIENVVASQGTAFTEFHARMLKRQADGVVICFDADSAGIKAAERAFETLAPTDLEIRCVALPQGDDPDSLVRSKGRDAFADLLANSKEFLDFIIDHFEAREDVFSARNRTALIERCAKHIGVYAKTASREQAIRRLAARLKVADSTISKIVAASLKKDDAAKKPLPEYFAIPLRSNIDKLCRIALADVDALQWIRNLSVNAFFDDVPGSDVLNWLREARFDPSQPASLNGIITSLDDSLRTELTRLMAYPVPPGGLEICKALFDSLQIERLDYLIQRAQTQLKQPDLSPEAEGKLHEQIIAWRKEYLDRRKRSSDSLSP